MFSPLSFNIVLEALDGAIKNFFLKAKKEKGEERKDRRKKKEKIKLSLFAANMIVYIEIPMLKKEIKH